jgi:HTH-type transcriptional regulator/antitoxin HigA
MKNNASDLIPGDVFHPSEIVKDEMEARGIKQVDIAKITGFNKSFISLFLKGERDINIKLAIALETLLSIKAEFWIRLQKQYEMNKALIELQKAKMAS